MQEGNRREGKRAEKRKVEGVDNQNKEELFLPLAVEGGGRRKISEMSEKMRLGVGSGRRVESLAAEY